VLTVVTAFVRFQAGHFRTATIYDYRHFTHSERSLERLAWERAI